MKLYLTLMFLLNLFICIAQKTNSKYILDKKCYSLTEQQSLNACLSEKAKTIEKLVRDKYTCILRYFQNEIENCRDKKCEDLEYYIKNKNDFVNSQKTWKSLKEQNAEFWSGGGGTTTNQYIAESIIKDCKDRLHWFDSIIEEDGQGGTSILKCQ